MRRKIAALFVTCPLLPLAQSDRDTLVQNIEGKRAVVRGEGLTRV